VIYFSLELLRKEEKLAISDFDIGTTSAYE